MNQLLFWPAPACPLLNMLNATEIQVLEKKYLPLGEGKRLHHSFFPLCLKCETLYMYVLIFKATTAALGGQQSVRDRMLAALTLGP